MRLKWSEAGRYALVGAALAAAALAASCGGSSGPGTTFVASRVIVFGDETSLIVDSDHNGNGHKFTENATVGQGDPTVVCSANPIWIQAVTTLYGLVFPECNTGPTPASSPPSRIRAALGAGAFDLGGQIDAQLAESALGQGDLVTVLVGQNDVINQYLQYPVLSEPQITANVEAAGAEAGRQVNRLAATGAKVLIATIVDTGLSPLGRSEQNSHADTDRAALLTRLTVRYNASLRATMTNDGRIIGLVLFDELVATLVRFPGLDNFTNLTDPVCDLTKSQLIPPSILDCTQDTLVDGGTAAYLWADDRHIGASAHNLLGGLATSRAQNNPF
jgi:outer membrane lipase/esterase